MDPYQGIPLAPPGLGVSPAISQILQIWLMGRVPWTLPGPPPGVLESIPRMDSQTPFGGLGYPPSGDT